MKKLAIIFYKGYNKAENLQVLITGPAKNSESLWIGTDMKKFNEIRTQLEKEGIPYKYKTKDHLSQTMYPAEGTLRSRTGSFGNKPDQMIEYEILVHKKDYEKVRGKF